MTYNPSSMTLTCNSNGALVLDTISSFNIGDRVIIWGFGLANTAYSLAYSFPNTPPINPSVASNASQNGIYVVTNPGSISSNFVLTRASDFNKSSAFTSGVPQILIIPQSGAVFASQSFGFLVSTPFVLDTSPILLLPQLFNTSLSVKSLQLVPSFYSSANATIVLGSSLVVLEDNGSVGGTWTIALPSPASSQFAKIELVNPGTRTCQVTGTFADVYGTPASSVQLTTGQRAEFFFGNAFAAWRPMMSGYTLAP